MTTITKNTDHQLDQAQQERLRICAELGQVVPINKARTVQHYTGMLDELRSENASDVND